MVKTYILCGLDGSIIGAQKPKAVHTYATERPIDKMAQTSSTSMLAGGFQKYVWESHPGGPAIDGHKLVGMILKSV